MVSEICVSLSSQFDDYLCFVSLLIFPPFREQLISEGKNIYLHVYFHSSQSSLFHLLLLILRVTGSWSQSQLLFSERRSILDESAVCHRANTDRLTTTHIHTHSQFKITNEPDMYVANLWEKPEHVVKVYTGTGRKCMLITESPLADLNPDGCTVVQWLALTPPSKLLWVYFLRLNRRFNQANRPALTPQLHLPVRDITHVNTVKKNVARHSTKSSQNIVRMYKALFQTGRATTHPDYSHTLAAAASCHHWTISPAVLRRESYGTDVYHASVVSLFKTRISVILVFLRCFSVASRKQIVRINWANWRGKCKCSTSVLVFNRFNQM